MKTITAFVATVLKLISAACFDVEEADHARVAEESRKARAEHALYFPRS